MLVVLYTVNVYIYDLFHILPSLINRSMERMYDTP